MESNLTCEVPDIAVPMPGNIAENVTAARSLNIEQIESLTAREREILELLSRGLSYKMAAAELNLAMGTIQTYIGRIYKKLHVHCRLEAVLKYVAASGLSPNNFLQD